jgi:2-oxoglutarate dehydrogenase E1 component
MEKLQRTMQQWLASSAFSAGSATYLEDLYEQFLENPDSIPEQWQAVFYELPVERDDAEIAHSQIKDYFIAQAKVNKTSAPQKVSTDLKQIGVLELLNAYRQHGHRIAKLDPLEIKKPEDVASLRLSAHGLTQADLDSEFFIDPLHPSRKILLKILLKRLQSVYCSSVGAEYLHLEQDDEREWIRHWLEDKWEKISLTKAEQSQILYLLTAAEGFEKYTGSKFPGAKRFGLEGGESLIPMLDELIQSSGRVGTKEIIIGMAHRGRLNVLVNIFGKVTQELFDEFAGKRTSSTDGSGDVKYHQGFSSDIKTDGGVVHLALAFNPSHLEIASPVVEGSVLARQQRRSDISQNQVVPIILHGDSAFAGQGVVMETFNMSQTRGYKTGGTVHIVVNNQVGFTTDKPEDVRSTRYCTDVAKMVAAPVFHVNGDDPEAVIKTTRLALDYRMTFNKDVVIDLVCYRRHGHNEADEPSATQPLMYKVIKKHPTTRKIYADKLVNENGFKEIDVKSIVNTYRDLLDVGKSVVPSWIPMQHHKFTVDWRPYINQEWTAEADTTLSADFITQAAKTLTCLPKNFKLQPRVAKIVIDRSKMYSGEVALDWGAAETLAYAGLVDEGIRVRLSGQDSGRGTFFHRHAVWHEQQTGEAYVPLQHISKKQGDFTVIDSVLSEEAVLAFEYGYSSTEPRSLVIWEGQFGDFANGAQVVIDQFISSGERKWGRLSGLVMLLPHGYEGQGPEHSSARLERYLQLCAEHNMQVCVPSTPAQVFHMLRRQAIRPLRRPLIVMSPKSLLRHKLAVSDLDDMKNGRFHNVIPEIDALDSSGVNRIVLCSGKVYYDLLEKRREKMLENVAIVRIEQLYPFPAEELKAILAEYPNVKEFIWCQEEPLNQGAWYSSHHHFEACTHAGTEVIFAGREASAAPAAGYMSQHNREQNQLVEDALGIKQP